MVTCGDVQRACCWPCACHCVCQEWGVGRDIPVPWKNGQACLIGNEVVAAGVWDMLDV